MTEDVVLLEPGDERAKKIGKAMASQTANDILSLLKEGDLTLTEISDNMGQPMTTIKYHVENLLDAGLIEVQKIKYSEKGREVKVYSVCEQVVIVSAGTKDIRQILMKYASVFGLLILATLVIGLISSSMFAGFLDYQLSGSYYQNDDLTYLAEFNESGDQYVQGDQSILAVPAPNADSEKITMSSKIYEESSNLSINSPEAARIGSGSYYQQDSAPEEAVHMLVTGFFLGGCAVMVILMIYEAVIWRREKSYWDKKRNKKINSKK